MNIDILTHNPAIIVVSNECENEFKQERENESSENESSENAKENRTRRREDHARNCITQQESTSETKFVRRVTFYQDFNTMPVRGRLKC